MLRDDVAVVVVAAVHVLDAKGHIVTTYHHHQLAIGTYDDCECKKCCFRCCVSFNNDAAAVVINEIC